MRLELYLERQLNILALLQSHIETSCINFRECDHGTYKNVSSFVLSGEGVYRSREDRDHVRFFVITL
jgi:hypothetical protein